MLEYFLLPDLKIDKELFSNKVKEQCESWGHFGTGRFKFYSGHPDDETLDYLDNTFKNAGVAIGTSATTLYTAPAGTTGIIHAIYISNVDGTNDATVDITVTDTSASATFHIMKTVLVPADSTLVIEKPINLEAQDVLQVKASAASDLEAFASVLEMN